LQCSSIKISEKVAYFQNFGKNENISKKILVGICVISQLDFLGTGKYFKEEATIAENFQKLLKVSAIAESFGNILNIFLQS